MQIKGQFHPGREPLQIYVQVQDGYILKLDIKWSPSLILCRLLKQQNPNFTEGVEVRWNKHGATWDTCLQRQHSPQHTRPNKCNKSPTQNLCEGKQLQLRGKVLHCTRAEHLYDWVPWLHKKEAVPVWCGGTSLACTQTSTQTNSFRKTEWNTC